MLQHPDIDSLPIGLIVRHLPAKVKAMPDGADDTAFRWEYRTAVSAVSDCEILGFAACRWDDGRWVPCNPDGTFFTAGDFAEWYPDSAGRIAAGDGFADPRNFTTGADLVAARMKWVFVAQQSSGRRVKGEAIVELLPELEPRARPSSDPLERFFANAEHFRKQMAQYTGAQLAYDEAGIQWLDDHVANHRDKLRGNAGWFDKAGSFFGECLRQVFGARWEANAGDGDPWGIRIDDKLVVFPFAKLHKHIEDAGGGESITGMLVMIRPMMAVNAHKVKRMRVVDGKVAPVEAPPPRPEPPGRPSGGSWIPWRRK